MKSNHHLPICKSAHFLLFALFFSSCFSLKPVTFKQADHLSVSNALTEPQVSFDMIFANPNTFGCKVTSIEAKASVNNGSLFSYQLEKPFRIARNTDFSIPVRITMPLEDLLKALPSAMSLLSGNQSVPFKLSGKVTLKKFLFKRTFAF